MTDLAPIAVLPPSALDDSPRDPADLLNRARRVKLLCVDVDGTLTDAGMYYGPDGEVMKKFNTRDGMGLARVRQVGVAVAIISGENSAIVHARATKLKIDDVFAGAQNKREAIDELCSRHGLTLEELAFIGDDLNDAPALNCVGLACVVADAARATKDLAHYVATRRGGDGAVREVCELIYTAKTEPALADDPALLALVQ